jgi:hypothetical protein
MDALAETIRKRTARAGRPPTTPRVELTPREDVWLHALNIHGPLPTPFLYAFTEDRTPSLRHTQNRLTQLFHAQVETGSAGYLDRPGQRFKVIGIEKHEVYANTPYADEHLSVNGLSSRRSPVLHKVNYHHECFSAAISASIELGCRRDPELEYLCEHDLLSRAPSHSREVPCYIEHDYKLWDKDNSGWRFEHRTGDTSLIPDAYFAIKRTLDGEQSYCAFFLEADCGTEPLTRHDLNEKSWLATLLKYRHLIETGKYKPHFGLNCGALVLIVTTTQRQAEGIKRILLQITDGKGSPYFLFKTWHDFGDEFFVPKEPHYSLLTEPYQRAGISRETGQDYLPLAITTRS